MPLVVYVFSGVLFLLGGVLALFEGASLAPVAGEISGSGLSDALVFAEAPRKTEHKAVESPFSPLRAERESICARARPLAKPARQREDRSEAQWEYAVRGGHRAPVFLAPQTGFAPNAKVVLEAPSDLAVQDAYWVRPAVLEPYSESGFHLYDAMGDISVGGDTCWTMSYDSAGAAWSPDDCRPSVLQAADSIDPLVLPRASYHIGFTTKIRHSVVGLRISRKLN